MGYRIVYERPRRTGLWWGAGILLALAVWLAAGEGLYEDFARYVGGMIRGA